MLLLHWVRVVCGAVHTTRHSTCGRRDAADNSKLTRTACFRAHGALAWLLRAADRTIIPNRMYPNPRTPVLASAICLCNVGTHVCEVCLGVALWSVTNVKNRIDTHDTNQEHWKRGRHTRSRCHIVQKSPCVTR